MALHFNSTEELMSELFKFVGGVDITTRANQFAYQAFDPAVMANEFLTKCNADKKLSGHLITLITFGHIAHIQGLGSKAIMAYVNDHGTSADSFKKKVRAAFAALDVKVGNPNDKKAFTVPRLMHAFPKVCFNIFVAMLEKNKVTFRAVYSGNLPYCLRWNGSPAVMTRDVWDLYKMDYCEYSMVTNKQSSQDAIKYAELAYNSQACPVKYRVDIATIKETEAKIEKKRSEQASSRGVKSQDDSNRSDV